MIRGAVFLAIAVIGVRAVGRSQTVKVAGEVFCPSDPDRAHNILVNLMDHDSVGPDDYMASTRTVNGTFQLEGSESEITNIDPRLEIYHDCNDYSRIGVPIPCQRRWRIKIPDKYINSNEVMELGSLNLEMLMWEEDHDCIH